MFWFLLFQILGFIALLFIIKMLCYFKKQKFFAFIRDNFKRCAIGELVIFIIITLLCAKPLYHTTHCYFTGKSMKAETKYSWYLQECQVKTRSGSYVPIRTSRGLPDGGHESDDYIADDQYLY